jgi:hypothetical protein
VSSPAAEPPAEIMGVDPPPGLAAVDPHVLRDLRRERRRRRVADIEWFEALYRVYLVGFLGIFITLLVSSALGDGEASAEAVADVRRYGPAAVGVVAALAIAVGLRSGSRGGPLALEPAEVRFVLLAPIDRFRAVLGPALRQTRYAAFVGVMVGAAVGQLGSRRLPGTLLPWASAGALSGLLIGLLLVGVGYAASGLRLHRAIATVLGAAVIAWAVADLVLGVPCPTTAVGGIALWPLRVHPVELLAVPAVVGIVVLGVSRLGGISLEAAEVRTALVGQLRFAVTVQDLRTVLVLRRQLAQERPRVRPWIALHRPGRWSVWRRDWRGYLRFPAARLARMVLLVAVAAVALHVAFHDARPAALISGLALYLVGLDILEPLAQEVDQLDRADSVPVERGVLLARHLPAAAAVMVLCALIGGGVAVALNRTLLSLALAAICAPAAVVAGSAGAAVSLMQALPSDSTPGSTQELLPPEVAGMRVVVRTVWPLLVAVVGGVPVVLAHGAAEQGVSEIASALQGVMLVVVVTGLIAAWVRYREPARAWWRNLLEEGQKATEERTAQKNARRTA